MKYLILFFSLLFFSNAHSQNYLFKPAVSGAHFGTQYYNVYDLNYLSMDLGYTFKARLTADLKTTYIQSKVSPGMQYRGGLSYMILKEGYKNQAFSLSIDGGYTLGKFKRFTKYNITDIGISVYKRFTLTDKISLVPGVSIFQNYENLTILSSGEVLPSKYLGYRFHLPILINKFTISPSLTRMDGFTYFAIGVGFIFPFNASK